MLAAEERGRRSGGDIRSSLNLLLVSISEKQPGKPTSRFAPSCFLIASHNSVVIGARRKWLDRLASRPSRECLSLLLFIGWCATDAFGSEAADVGVSVASAAATLIGHDGNAVITVPRDPLQTGFHIWFMISETIAERQMRVLGYIGVALWISLGVVIFLWSFILSAQMMNNRVPKHWPILGRRQFSFQTDPADYTALGQLYRQKSIRAEVALLAYLPTFVLAIFIASWI